MSDKRSLDEYEPGRTGISVANLSGGASLTVMMIEDAFIDETEYSDDAIHVPCRIEAAPEGFEDMSGEPIESGEDNEYNIINSSSAFYNALVDAVGTSDHQGDVITITARQPGSEATSRYYEIEAE